MTNENKKTVDQNALHYTNIITYSGIVVGDLTFSHNAYGESFYSIMVKSYRKNINNYDIVPVILSERFIDLNKVSDGTVIRIEGQWRTRNVDKEDGRKKLEQFLFVQSFEILADNIDELEHFNYENVLKIKGYVTKKPSFRTTPLGRKITDVMIAVNRPYGKSSYIPCVIWGRGAESASIHLDIGSKITAEGRIQSREYYKTTSDGNRETKVVYEYSISNLWLEDKLICGNIRTTNSTTEE